MDRLFAKVDPFYFVTFKTAARQRILAHPEIHDAFRAFCVAAYQKYNIAVGTYVIMPDHVHLFVALPREGMTVSRWIQSLRSLVGKELLRIGIQKPHWQEGFFDHVLRSSESYSEKWDYVRMNPVRAGLCARPEQWAYQGEIMRVEY
ncbi:MAG TPA: transposase [Chthoniobacterales bacterium]